MTANGPEAVQGLTSAPIEALRYESKNTSPYEVFGRVSAFLRPGAKVLDIGCGTGAQSALLRDHCGVEIVGIEPNHERAAFARARGLDVMTGFYSSELVANRGPFDFVVLTDVLEHLENPAAILTAIRASLAPGGKVVVSVPNVAHWTVRASLLLGRFDYTPTGIMDATHLRWFTLKSIRALFEGCGYDIVGLNSTSGGWMRQYHMTPLRVIPRNKRAAVVAQLCKAFPGMFSCQFIVCGAPRQDGAHGAPTLGWKNGATTVPHKQDVSRVSDGRGPPYCCS